MVGNDALKAYRIVMTENKKKAKIIKADYGLRQKIGRGPLDGKLVKKCQEVMEATKADFAPQARDYLKQLEASIKKCQAGELEGSEALEALGNPVMLLKGHAAMFRYPLISRLANIMLGFLEVVEKIDPDVLEIVEAHRVTLKTIVSSKLEGDGGQRGAKLQGELKDACARYFKKKETI